MPNTTEKLYGLIFDIDGVIADTESINTIATARVFAELFDLKDVKQEDFELGLGRGAEQYVIAGASVHGLELTEPQVRKATQLRQDYFFEVLRSRPLPPFPGVMELIDQAITAQDFRLAIATSGTQEKSMAVLEATKVPYQQMVYINGNMVKNKKPDPELFLTAIGQLGLPASRCVVIEDAPNGVQAAKAAGAKCIAVTNSATAEKLSNADFVCASLKQVNLITLRNLVDSIATAS